MDRIIYKSQAVKVVKISVDHAPEVAPTPSEIRSTCLEKSQILLYEINKS